MRSGGFAVSLPTPDGDDPVAALGQELNELARWLERQFTAFERLQELAEHVSQGVLLEDERRPGGCAREGAPTGRDG